MRASALALACDMGCLALWDVPERLATACQAFPDVPGERVCDFVRPYWESARGSRGKADASTSLNGQSDFSDLEDRWLRLAASYEFSERLTGRLNDQDAHKRTVRTLLYRAGAVRGVAQDNRDGLGIDGRSRGTLGGT